MLILTNHTIKYYNVVAITHIFRTCTKHNKVFYFVYSLKIFSIATSVLNLSIALTCDRRYIGYPLQSLTLFFQPLVPQASANRSAHSLRDGATT